MMLDDDAQNLLSRLHDRGLKLVELAEELKEEGQAIAAACQQALDDAEGVEGSEVIPRPPMLSGPRIPSTAMVSNGDHQERLSKLYLWDGGAYKGDKSDLAVRSGGTAPAIGEMFTGGGEDNPGNVSISLDVSKRGNQSTNTHEVHLPMNRPTRNAAFEIEVRFGHSDGSHWDWGKTGKIGGLVGFNDGDWDNWPGGGRNGGENFSVRNTWWRWFRDGAKPPEPRLATYLYLGLPEAEFIRPMPSHETGRYISNGGHTVEFYLNDYGTPPVGEWIKIRNEVYVNDKGKRNGRVITIVDDRKVLDLANVPLVGSYLGNTNPDGLARFSHSKGGAVTRAYISLMFGGGEGFGPFTPNGRATMAYRNLKVIDLGGDD